MRPQSDTAFVMAFGGDIKLWQSSTANRQDLIDAIARLKQPGWGTRFFDALYSACSGELLSAGGNKTVHRAIVVLSDGDDTDSIHSLRDVVASAQRSEIQVYALTIRSSKVEGRGDRILRRLTDATGGRLYVAQSAGDLGAAFAQIERRSAHSVLRLLPSATIDTGISFAAPRGSPFAEAGGTRPPGLLRHGTVRPRLALRSSLFAIRYSLFAFAAFRFSLNPQPVSS